MVGIVALDGPEYSAALLGGFAVGTSVAPMQLPTMALDPEPLADQLAAVIDQTEIRSRRLTDPARPGSVSQRFRR